MCLVLIIKIQIQINLLDQLAFYSKYIEINGFAKYLPK